jgi:hypothetical protein
MPGKTEEDTSVPSKAAATATAEQAAKSPSGGAAHGAAMPSVDAAFRSLLEPLAQRLARIELKLASAVAAGEDSANPPARPAVPASESTAKPSGGLSGEGLELLKALQVQLDKIDKRTAASGAAAPPTESPGHREDHANRQAGPGPQVVEQVVQNVRKDLQDVYKKLVSDFQRLLELRTPAAAPAPAATPVTPQAEPIEADDDLWKEAILGEELCRDSSIAEGRSRLFRGVLADDAAAKGLAGQILLAQSAAPDRLPPLMKEVGEAYYRFRPKTAGVSDPLEAALAAWLKRRCDALGLGNTIELVIVGDRFDAARHNALERGATITAVQGWVVLRDNGKVYTKANVSVK